MREIRELTYTLGNLNESIYSPAGAVIRDTCFFKKQERKTDEQTDEQTYNKSSKLT